MILIKYRKYFKFIFFLILIIISIYMIKMHSSISMNVVYNQELILTNNTPDYSDYEVNDNELIERSSKIFSSLLEIDFNSNDYNVLKNSNSNDNLTENITLIFKDKSSNKSTYKISYNLHSGELMYISILSNNKNNINIKFENNISHEDLTNLAYTFLSRLPLPSPEGIKPVKTLSDSVRVFSNSITRKTYFLEFNQRDHELYSISIVNEL